MKIKEFRLSRGMTLHGPLHGPHKPPHGSHGPPHGLPQRPHETHRWTCSPRCCGSMSVQGRRMRNARI